MAVVNLHLTAKIAENTKVKMIVLFSDEIESIVVGYDGYDLANVLDD